MGPILCAGCRGTCYEESQDTGDLGKGCGQSTCDVFLGRWSWLMYVHLLVGKSLEPDFTVLAHYHCNVAQHIPRDFMSRRIVVQNTC